MRGRVQEPKKKADSCETHDIAVFSDRKIVSCSWPIPEALQLNKSLVWIYRDDTWVR